MFYLVHHEGKQNHKYAYKDLSFIDVQQATCEACGRGVVSFCYGQGEKHRLVVEGGNVYPDYLQFCGAGKRLFLLSQTAEEIVVQNQISGIVRESEVQLFDLRHHMISDISRYFSMEICGEIELNASAMKLKKKRFCEKCGQYTWNRKSLGPIILDPNTWNGSDLCRIKSIPGYFVCTDRFAEMVRCNGLTGFSFEKLSLL